MSDMYSNPDNTPSESNYVSSTPADESRPSGKSRSAKLIVLGLLLLLLVGGAIATVLRIGDTKNSSVSAREREVVTVLITAEGFVPATLQIKPGTQVVWRNQDTVAHDLTVRDQNSQPLDISEQLAAGESFSVILDEQKDYFVQSPADGIKFQGSIKVKAE